MHIDQKRCHLPLIFRRLLPSSNIFVSSNLNPYELATPKEGGLHFILNDISNYNFDVKVGHCRFVSFVNDVIVCECLGYVFCFRIKEKRERHIL